MEGHCVWYFRRIMRMELTGKQRSEDALRKSNSKKKNFFAYKNGNQQFVGNEQSQEKRLIEDMLDNIAPWQELCCVSSALDSKILNYRHANRGNLKWTTRRKEIQG